MTEILSDFIRLKKVSQSDYDFLFKLLRKRDSSVNISHRKMPTYQKHIKFVKSRPYSKWYIIWSLDSRIGSAYLTKQDEITVHLEKDYDKKTIREFVIKLIMQNNPRERYFINVNPHNKKIIKFLKTLGCSLLQQTYEITPKRLRIRV